jgi:predicted ABC-class ATPase
MAIPQGITLICGGGFHGKSTLLQALQGAIYPKVADDGREFCVVRRQTTTVRAEDGRAVQAVNITDFLTNLPGGGNKDTVCFSTDNASGSTSQASSIVEVRTRVCVCVYVNVTENDCTHQTGGVLFHG